MFCYDLESNIENRVKNTISATVLKPVEIKNICNLTVGP